MSSDVATSTAPQPLPTDATANNENNSSQDATENATPISRPLHIYTRPQMLHLYHSPMVKPPENMPILKDWFGPENEQNMNKKDAEPSTPNSARERDRRFRRDADDADSSTRPPFRSTATQPSQMGNFKHQSIRTDRGERERERDIRDKEGQERLRSLSDKFDQGDRIALTLPGLRTKERDTVPHLSPGTSRLAGQSQLASAATRRTELRDGTKKKTGEASEDWRRGVDARRSPREDRADNRGDQQDRPKRKDRDDPTGPRRDRERSLDRHPRDAEDTADSRRPERDKDTAKDQDDDPRRWKDDGKRDERMAANKRDRARDRPPHEATSNDQKGWTVVEERDVRSKRNGGRDRKPQDEKDERRGVTDREKDKEPAWMDTYVPSTSSAGILGGQGADGELDGIQAWKKGLKEKEMKDKEDKLKDGNETLPSGEGAPASDNAMDEIQMFKLLMKREQQHKPPSTGDDDALNPPSAPPTSTNNRTEQLHSHEGASSLGRSSASLLSSMTPSSEAALPPALSSDAAPLLDPQQSLLSILKSGSTSGLGDRQPTASRMFPTPVSRAMTSTPPQATALNDASFAGNSYNPPAGSRLLALGQRTAAKPLNQPSSQPTNLQTSTPPPPSGSAPQDILADGRSQSHFFDDRRTQQVPVEQLRRPDSAMRMEQEAAYGGNRGGGSRFARFFDGRAREPGQVSKPQTPSTGLHEQEHYVTLPGHSDNRPLDDILGMLNSHTPLHTFAQNNPPNQNHSSLHQNHLLHQSQAPPMRVDNRMEALYESRLDRNFVQDGLAPGMRSVLPLRNRDSNMYADVNDEPYYAAQRLQQAQHRESLYQQSTAHYAQQPLRNAGLAQHYRGPSPISGQHHLQSQNAHLQRLPPGLANLGMRPPHEPAQFLGGQGMAHGLPLNNGPAQQQQFNNVGFGGPQQLRPHGHQQPPITQHQLPGPGGLDMRHASQAQLLALQSGLRGGGNGGNFAPPSHPTNPSMLLAMRQQQQQQQMQMMAPILPQHLQHPLPPNSQTQNLMALLLGGQPTRE